MSTATTPSRLRNRRGEGARLRDEIVRAAADLLDATGSEEAVTLRAVARRAGIAAPSIYAHFADREAMVFAVVEDALAALHDRLQAAADAPAPHPAARLRGVCAAYLQFSLDYPQRYRVIFGGLWNAAAADRSPEVAAAATTVGLAEFDILAGALAECAAAGMSSSTDPYADAVALWTGLHGLAVLRPVTPVFPWPATVADDLVERLALLRAD